MVYYEDENCILIPIHLNMSFFPELNNREYQTFFEDTITSIFINNICKLLLSIPKNHYILDFSRISSQSRDDGLFKAINELDSSTRSRISFVNLSEYYSAKISIELGIQCLDEFSTWANCDGDLNDYSQAAALMQRNKVIEILKDVTQEYNEKYKYLESSSVFLNKYVKFKDVFIRPGDLKILLYALYCKIVDTSDFYDSRSYTFKFSSFISASPVGAVLAQNLGNMIKVPITYIHNLGPRFAVSNDFSNISPEKEFLFIYDFICLGTEYKLLQAIAHSRGFSIVGGVGIASLVQPSKIQAAINEEMQGNSGEKVHNTSLEKIHSLLYVNEQDINLGYNIYHSQKAGAQ